MAVNLSPYGGVGTQFFDNSGNVLTGGKIFTYAGGTTTPQAAYTSSNGITPHSNPIILNASGRVPGGEIWLTDGLVYKFILRDANDVLIATYDGVSGINSNFVAFTNQQEIQTATAGQTVFDLTTISYQPGTNSLSVFVDGVNQYGPGAQYAYLETDSDTVTFVNGLHVGAEVKFTTSQLNSSVSQTNAFQVSYTPPFTGSVATNVGDKLAQTVSVKDFGAVGDGVVDDTTAFQNAASLGKTVYIPEGNYKITNTIDCVAGTCFFGDGTANSIITANFNAPVLRYLNVNTYGCFIKDLRIDGNGLSTGIFIGATLEVTAHMLISNVTLFNHAKGIDGGASTFSMFDSVLEKVDFLGCTDFGLGLGGSQNTLNGCTFRLCKWGIYQYSPSGFSVGGGALFGGVFIANTYDIVIGNNTVRPLSFIETWFEQTKTATVGYTITGVTIWWQTLTFKSCLFQPAATATSNGVFLIPSSPPMHGTISFENCCVFTDLYASATIPEVNLVSTGVTNELLYSRINCCTVNGSAVITPLVSSVANTGITYQSSATAFDLKVQSNTGAQIRAFRYTSDVFAPIIAGAKYRGSIASPTAVNASDALVSFQGLGYDGSAIQLVGALNFIVDGPVSAGNLPTRASMFITPPGSATAVERFTLNNIGLGLGTTSPTSKLQVTGLPVYANNAAAIAGGLTAGAFYRTGADPDPVCVVH